MLADYRMPQMNGIEFLEEVMDLHPLARRALLTAYADTDAAIQAINVVDVDHYLLKPWEPPEEKLYPVVDALIEMWRALGDRPVEETVQRQPGQGMGVDAVARPADLDAVLAEANTRGLGVHVGADGVYDCVEHTGEPTSG